MVTAENWKEILLEAARQSYASSQQGIILSRIPSILRHSGIETSQILSEGRKLRELIATEAAAELRLIQNEMRPLDWVILPSDVNISEPHSKYFPDSKDRESVNTPKRFISAFWQGFIRHIPNGHRRWLTRSNGIVIEDQVGGVPPVGAIEIERIYTAKPDELVISNSVVLARIEEWSSAHGLDPNEFVAKLDHPRQSAATKIDSHGLASMFRSMTPEELERISIPLDIVARYLSTIKDK